MHGGIVALMALVFTVMVAVLGVLVRVIVKWTRIEDKLTTVSEDLQDLVKDKDKVHKEMLDQMREDRNATNKRLTYLERSVWPRQTQRRRT